MELRGPPHSDMKGASGMDGVPKVSEGGCLNGQGVNCLLCFRTVADFCSEFLMKPKGGY